MTNDEINILIATKLFGYKNVGFYGPTKSRGTHLDQILCSCRQEALDLQIKYHPESPSCSGKIKSIEDIYLCYWKEDYGTLMLPDYAGDLENAWGIVELLSEKYKSVVILKSDGLRKNMKYTCLANDLERSDSETPAMAICLMALKFIKKNIG